MKTSTKYIGLICSIAALGGFLFGFDTAVISGANLYIQSYFDLGDWEFGFVVSSMIIGCALGGLLAFWPSEAYGRRETLMATALLFAISAIGSALASNTTEFVFYRFIGGLGVGGASMLSPLYISEITPANIRGKMISLNQLTIVIGITVAFFTNYFLSNLPESIGWRWMLGVEVFPALLLFLLLFIVPHSPRWLVWKSRIPEAIVVLQKINGKDRTEKILKEITNSLNISEEKKNLNSNRLFNKKNKPFVKIAIVMAILQQVTGIVVIMYYAPNIFESIGLTKSSAILQTAVIGSTMTLFTILAMFLVYKIGRKALLLYGSAGMFFMLWILSITFFLEYLNLFVVLSAILGFIAFFSISAGPVVWILIGEIIPNRVRSQGMALATFSMWMTNYIITLTFPTLLNVFSGGQRGYTFIVYSLFCAILYLFVYHKLPETKGKTLEEIELIFIKNRIYETTSK